jgi:TonB family protein
VGTPLADPLRGVAEAIARGDRLGEATAPGAAIGSPDGVFSESTVERPVIAIPGVVPRYPERLRGQGQEGRVVVRFVVDTTGRVEGGSVQVTSAAHALFADAVRRTLPAMRFRPAEARGHRVRQLVEMPFDFVLSR